MSELARIKNAVIKLKFDKLGRDDGGLETYRDESLTESATQEQDENQTQAETLSDSQEPDMDFHNPEFKNSLLEALRTHETSDESVLDRVVTLQESDIRSKKFLKLNKFVSTLIGTLHRHQHKAHKVGLSLGRLKQLTCPDKRHLLSITLKMLEERGIVRASIIQEKLLYSLTAETAHQLDSQISDALLKSMKGRSR